MTEQFLTLPAAARREVLQAASIETGRPAYLLEKDVWVVWALATLFDSPFGGHLVFKGGTSLSKAYDVINRFSEDVDITYDIRRIAPDLTAKYGTVIPPTRSQEGKWTKEIRKRLAVWIRETMQPLVDGAIGSDGVNAVTRLEDDKLLIDYESVAPDSEYVASVVTLEFGARSTGEPANVREIACDAAGPLSGLVLPTANPRVMIPQRTFWEKATAIHVYCLQGRIRSEHLSRHWYDLVKLNEAGFASSAVADRALADAVAQHKSAFFREKTANRTVIDYKAAVNGGLRLVPEATARDELGEDYRRMIDAGLLLEEADSFEDILERCSDIAARANQAAG